ncbi:hypothetical protein VN24_16350 [Paenibacillus beijingensis]|uniref:RNA 2',3'-cyclic phosphodiesterase n=1 Tax=Paenibacillus beijingensis TaxID=1126833 RepID=A0A0D5NRL1_9BACL|nr:hypothetical protein VN24_16350 [Paenibacillus beijingensis]
MAVSDNIRQALGAQLHGWRKLSFSRWAHPEDWHLTLHFVGETPENNLPAVCEALDEASRWAKPFRITLSGLGVFGPPKKPSVLWLGLTEMPPELRALHERLGGTLLLHIGYEAERRPYRPHLTLARKYEGTAPFDSSSLANEHPQLIWTASEAVLYRSRLGQVPMYEIIHRSSFQGSHE